jgi:hypothetical protein
MKADGLPAAGPLAGTREGGSGRVAFDLPNPWTVVARDESGPRYLTKALQMEGFRLSRANGPGPVGPLRAQFGFLPRRFRKP